MKELGHVIFFLNTHRCSLRVIYIYILEFCTKIMEENMETTIVIVVLYRHNGKEHGNYYSMLGF